MNRWLGFDAESEGRALVWALTETEAVSKSSIAMPIPGLRVGIVLPQHEIIGSCPKAPKSLIISIAHPSGMCSKSGHFGCEFHQ